MRSEKDWKQYREMSDELRLLCIDAVKLDGDIELSARENCNAIGNVTITNYDSSYLEFLKEQIDLGTRGPEWIDRLKERLKNYSNHINRELADCNLIYNELSYSFLIDPINKKVLHWEKYHD